MHVDNSGSTRASTSSLLAELRGHKRGARRRHDYSMQQRLRVQLPSLREAYAEKAREKEQETQRRKDAADRAEAAEAASAASRRESAGKLLWKRAKRDVGKRRMEKAEVRKLIAGSKVFAETLSPGMVRDLVEDAEQRTVDHGQFLFHQGDPGNGMYLVQSGQVEILRKIDSGEDGDGEGGGSDDESFMPDDDEVRDSYRFIVSLKRGDLFGETSMLVGAPRNAAARCTTEDRGHGNSKVRLLFISRQLYLRLQKHQQGGALSKSLQKTKNAILKQGILERVDAFKGLSAKTRSLILEMMRPREFKQGEYICRQGEKGSLFFLIIKGEVRVTVNDKDAKNGEKSLARLGPNKYFGEIALLSDDCTRTANVIADTNDAIKFDKGGSGSNTNNIVQMNKTDSSSSSSSSSSSNNVAVLCFVLHKSSFDALVTGHVRANMEANAEAARLGLLHASEKEPKLARSHRSQQSNPDNNPVETAEAVSPKTNDAYCFLTSEVFKALLRITTRRRIGSLVDHINLRPDDTLSAVETAPPADSTRLHVATRIAPKAAKALSLSALSSTLSSEKKAMENSKTQMALVMRKCLRRKSCGKRLDSELAFLLVALRTTRLFRNHTADWPPHLKTYLCNHGLHFKSVLKGRTLFKLGEMAEYAYLVMKGGLEEQAARNGIDRQSKLSARVNVVRPGDIAGELALKGVGSRVKTCIAQEKSDVLVINVGIFMTLAQRQPSFKERFALLRKVDALSAFDMRRAYTLAFSFSEEHPTKDTVVTDVGQTPAGLHVIMSGTIGVYVVDSDKGGTNDNDVQKKRLVSCLEQGEIFDSVGILAAVARLKRNHPGMRSTVQYVVHTHNCRLLELPVSSYNLILESSNTVDKLYQLECNRALVYGNSIQGWRNAINVVESSGSVKMETNRLSATAPLATAATVVKANDGTEERRPRAMSSIEKLVRRSRSESLVSAQQTLQGDYLRSLGRPFSKIALLAGTAVSPAIVRTRTHKEKDGPKEKDGQHDSRQEQHGATLAQNWWNQVDQFGAQATPAAGSQVAGLRSSSACLM